MIETPSSRLALSSTIYLIHHVFLPPKLPHEDDFNSDCEAILLDTTLEGLSKFRDSATNDQTDAIDSVIAMVTNMKSLHDYVGAEGAVSEEKFRNALRDLPKRGENVVFHLFGHPFDNFQVAHYRSTYVPRILVS